MKTKLLNKQRNIIYLLSIVIFTCIGIVSCKYDKAELTYPVTKAPVCDTTGIVYKNIDSILQANCNSCHSTANARRLGGGIILDNLIKIKQQGMNLYDAVSWNGNQENMPLNGSKLSDCDVNKILAWINNNYPQ